ncbi:MAG TPA: TIGR03560 family F420-dependent LLM class oxidoreductase [Anaerolineales bacterium]|nr:TIGR03560 family F420-dependent LLM class oxidoreductase [Anaerolineales bacterium]
MLDIAIMIEGQNGLTWPRWQKIALAVEELGFAGLYRSDHYTNANPPDKESLELWVSLTWLASHTSRIQFGPLVSPLSFRHPTMTARMAAAVDDLSAGRLTLGLGAGWQEREHTNFGWELLDIDGRFVRFREGLEIITRLLTSDTPLDFQGQYFQLKGAILLPRPSRPSGPPILIGGNGSRRTLPLVARYATEWNAVYISAQEFTQLSNRLDSLLADQGRQPGEVRRSLMTGCETGPTREEVARRVESRTQGRFTPEQLRERGLVVGTPAEIVAQLDTLAQAGVQRVMLQWLDLDDIHSLEMLARDVLPHFQDK